MNNHKNYPVFDNSRRRTDVYRRGARKKTKGTLSLALFVVVLLLVVAAGVMFVFKIFLKPEDVTHQPESSNIVSTEISSDAPSFEKYLSQFEKAKSGIDITASQPSLISSLEKDFDGDKENELLTICFSDKSDLRLEIIENRTSSVARSGVYIFAEEPDSVEFNVFLADEYICVESVKDGKFSAKFFNYDEVEGLCLEFDNSDEDMLNELNFNKEQTNTTKDGVSIISSFSINDGVIAID